MTSKQVLRKTIVAVSAATMVALATPGAATAAPVVPGDEVGSAGSTEGASLTGMPDAAKLKIHKMTPSTKTEGLPKNNGTEITDTASALPGSQPIKGVTFSAYKIENIDLKTNAGWRTANELVTAWEAMTDAQKQSASEISVGPKGSTTDYPITATAAWSGKTDENGLAQTAEDLPAGLYVVRETIDGDSVTIDGKSVPKGAVVKGSPFVVALPMTNPDNTAEWMREVNVYPKNSKSGVTKKVEDQDAHGRGNTEGNLGQSTVTYTISADIPAGYAMPLNQEENQDTADKNINRFRNFQLVDEFDSRVNYLGEDALKLVVEGDDSVDPVTLEATDDYTISWAPDSVEAPLDGTKHVKRAVVTLTDPGLAKLAAFSKAHPGKANKVVWTLDAAFASATVDADGNTVTSTDGTAAQTNEEAGQLSNQTWVIPDFPPNTGGGKNEPYKPTDEVPPNVPGAKVVSKYGKVVLNKTDSEDSKKKLSDVEFQLWTCDADGNKISKKPIMVDNKDTWKTNDEGQITISGLRLNDWINDSSEESGFIENPTEFYCLEETKAKAGYEKLPNLIKFQLLTKDPDFTKTLDVKNVPSNGGFDLPLTGGNGVFPLIALGGLLVAGSAGYAAYASRRKNARA